MPTPIVSKAEQAEPQPAAAQTAGAKLPSREEVQKLIEKAANGPVIVSNDPKRDEPLIRNILRLQGIPAQTIDGSLQEIGKEYAVTFPPRELGSCVAILQDFKNDDSMYVTPLVRKMSNDSEKAAEFRKFEALRSGATCQTTALTDSLGLSFTRGANESEARYRDRLNSREIIAQSYAEGAAALIYLRDAYNSENAKTVSNSVSLITAIRDERIAQRQPIAQLAIELLDEALKLPQQTVKDLKSNTAINDTVQGWIDARRPK